MDGLGTSVPGDRSLLSVFRPRVQVQGTRVLPSSYLLLALVEWLNLGKKCLRGDRNLLSVFRCRVHVGVTF